LHVNTNDSDYHLHFVIISFNIALLSVPRNREKIMQNAFAESISSYTEPNQADISLFSTRNYQITASDCVKTITTPATQRAELNENIAKSFDDLRRQGIAVENLILVGAIPFDSTQESSLKIYANHLKEQRRELSFDENVDQVAIKNKTRLTTEDHFKKTVNNALAEFEAQRIEKIVLSQSLEVEFSHPQQALKIAQNLIIKNPYAYSFSIPVSADSVLVGASPELLLSRQGKKVISNPLAGSARRTNDEQQNLNHIEHLQKSVKDNHEHRIVVDYIARHIAPYCSSLAISETPHILQTPTMMHLSSLFEGQLRGDAPDALNLALDLHPTPAVCGTPTELAKQFIIENEGYDRHYYTGLVGWMDSEGNGEWVVTIRCGLLSDNRIRLYAGAGIVKGSDADTEWHETESKQRTMLDVFSAQ
jgi:isochorismate synthase